MLTLNMQSLGVHIERTLSQICKTLHSNTRYQYSETCLKDLWNATTHFSWRFVTWFGAAFKNMRLDLDFTKKTFSMTSNKIVKISLNVCSFQINLGVFQLPGCVLSRYQCGTSGGRSDWSQKTSVWHLGKHGERSQQDGQHRSTRKDTGTVLQSTADVFNSLYLTR